MLRTVAGALVLGAGLLAAPAASQTRIDPAGTSASDTPVFHIIVVGRTTPAVNYRPRDGKTEIGFVGTVLLPEAKGKAEISGERGYMRIDARFDKLQPPQRFGREYLTYVLWAITPEGRAANLGEVQYDDDDARVKVTTEFQAFGLIVTAEPYFAVTQPSDVVVLENVVRDSTKGKVETIQARYDSLPRGTYLMNRDPGQLEVKALEPGAPLDLAQARNAVALARLAGADEYASDTYIRAVQLLNEAEQAREKKRRGDAVMMPARQAAQTAEDARLVALKRQEEAFAAAQRAASAQREQEALASAREAQQRARLEELRRVQAETEARLELERRRQAELDAQARETARQQADAQARAEEERRLQAERDAQARDAARQQAEALARVEQERRQQAEIAAEAREAARLQAEQQARAEEERRRQVEIEARVAAAATVAEREREAARAARESAEQARREADAARQAAAAERQKAESVIAQTEREKDELRVRVQEQLNVILETRETARGLIVNLSDVLFDTGSAALKPGAREKLARVAGVLASHPGLRVAVEGHTDSVGSAGFNQQLSEQRAAVVRDYLVGQGIAPGAVGTAGFGENQPVASNANAAGRQQNRRVEIVVTGEPIGR